MAKKQKSRDINVTAFQTLQAVTRPDKSVPVEPVKNPAAVSLGRLGGLKGGKARAAALTKAERAEIARKAAQARWKGLEEA